MWDRRRPSSAVRLYRWHRATMRGENPPIHEGDPQCGWYRMQRRANGPWIPVEIWCDQVTDETGELCQPEVLRAAAYGKPVDPAMIWTWLKPISRAEFLELTERRDKNANWIESDTQRINLAERPTRP